jgi:hypothetical protein
MIQAAGLKREHVIQALADIRCGMTGAFARSSKYQLKFEGEEFPPKAVLARAIFHLTGNEPSPKTFSGGEQTNRVLRGLGFEIISKDQGQPGDMP